MQHRWLAAFYYFVVFCNLLGSSYGWGFLQKQLNQTSKLLAYTEEQLRQNLYTLKERDFIISEQKKAGIAIWPFILKCAYPFSINFEIWYFQKMPWLTKHVFYGLT